jgi:hypothetical protein
VTASGAHLALLAAALVTGAAAGPSCLILAGTGLASHGAAGASLEDDIDRPGGDYLVFDLETPLPERCRDVCVGDARCIAYTYARPGTESPHPRCHLKASTPNAVPAPCCASGVKRAPTETGPVPAMAPAPPRR